MCDFIPPGWLSDDDPGWFGDEDIEDCDPSHFFISSSDWKLVNAAKGLAGKFACSDRVPAHQLTLLGLALLAHERLPAPTEGVAVELLVTTPRLTGHDMSLMRFWSVLIEEDQLILSSGGRVDLPHGSDNLGIFTWIAHPGVPSETIHHTDQLMALDGLGDFPPGMPAVEPWIDEIEAMNLARKDRNISVVDHGTSLPAAEGE